MRSAGFFSSSRSIVWASHLVILFPVWQGSLPAWSKGFLEQVFRPEFAYGAARQPRRFPRKLLGGRSARIIATVGMPGLLFRWYFHAHGLKSVQLSLLEFCGIKPVRTTLFGAVEAVSPARRHDWLERVRELGRLGV